MEEKDSLLHIAVAEENMKNLKISQKLYSITKLQYKVPNLTSQNKCQNWSSTSHLKVSLLMHKANMKLCVFQGDLPVGALEAKSTTVSIQIPGATIYSRIFAFKPMTLCGAG